jgi:hypothetical protein
MALARKTRLYRTVFVQNRRACAVGDALMTLLLPS